VWIFNKDGWLSVCKELLDAIADSSEKLSFRHVIVRDFVFAVSAFNIGVYK